MTAFTIGQSVRFNESCERAYGYSKRGTIVAIEGKQARVRWPRTEEPGGHVASSWSRMDGLPPHVETTTDLHVLRVAS